MKSNKKQNKTGGCFTCDHCQYHSEGDSYCDITFDFVLEDWCPTDEYMNCNGQHWREK